ncbi:MAG: DUF4157 domain-containing protein [Methylobacter sp.]|jgi:hypothetical protein|uniref:eCIS core domain-containing protein n=1 Tax=Methylobacter sp. TaxID=2051955 RepID=UPI0025E96A8E|nr:DUF4157 domain-containing protein [Methylobacter sp.]MCK9621372.1 DUF4157 domain-containing protein [Methylobacter sp.]
MNNYFAFLQPFSEQDTGLRNRRKAPEPSETAHTGARDIPEIPQTAGNLAVQQLFRSSTVQAKLAISQPGDPEEQEADQVADQIMSSATTGTIQRKCATCAKGTTCPKCEEEVKVQPKEKPDHYSQATPAVYSKIAPLRGGGSPLPPTTRAFMEPRFGADFSGVRLHTNSEAAQLNRAVSARAFTHGHDIYLGEGTNNVESSTGKQLLAHELAHVVQNSRRYGAREWIRRVPLPDYSQKGDTCDPASLMTALILWDKENSSVGSSNANIVGICNAALLYMSKNKPTLIGLYSRTGNGETLFDYNVQYLSATRDRLRTAGTSASEGEYQMLSTILYTFGHDASDVLRKLGLTGPKNKGGNTLADIFTDSDLKGLKPGESAQINWLSIVQQQSTDGRSSVGPHAFLIGRGKLGMWFLSDQGVSPALHLEANSLEEIRTNLNQVAAAGKTNIVTDPGQTNTTLGWTGVRILQSQSYSLPFQNLAPPGRFLAEVDAGWGTTGERVSTWDFVGTGYNLKEVEDLFKSSGAGHGFLIGEMPVGVYNVYKTNPVSSDNAAVTEIDKSDSKGGLLLNTSLFINAWLKLRTAKDSSISGLGFKVY